MLGVVATVGFVGLLAIPTLIVASVIVRGLVAAWQPRELVASLVEEGGGVPWLVGWVGVIWLGALSLVWAMFQGTWLLASWTAFKPLSIGFLQPILAVATVLGIVVGSRPVAALLAWIARKLDARWRRGGRTTLLRPWLIIGVAIVSAIAIAYVLWVFIVRRRLGAPETRFLHAPAAALVATIAVHGGWPWLARRVRLVSGALIATATVTAIVLAIVAAATRPSLTLRIWGAGPLARTAIGGVFDLERIRGDISLTQFRPAERVGAAHPDLVLVTIDGMRADRTPPYGGRAEMPALRDLGLRGAVFEWAFVSSTLTRRSLPSIALGLAANRVRGHTSPTELTLDPRHVLLAERLRAAGYETAGFACCDDLWRGGLARGLEQVVIEDDPGQLARTARAWLDTRERRTGNRPLFLWIHLQPPAGERTATTDEERRRFYDHGLATTDHALFELFGAFDQRAPAQAPIWIVTSDRGQGLGEHGQPYHASDLYSAGLQVPLVIAGPGVKPRRIVETVSLVDLVPTVLDLAGFVPPRTVALDGRSFGDLARGDRLGDASGGSAFASLISEHPAGRSSESPSGDLAAFVRGGWKLIDNGDSMELYDLKSDPAERYNLFGQRPLIVNELRVLLGNKLRATAQSPFE
ncbi:MAG: cell wall surface anchor family protein [Deltaproteobacteria bacterium]|nr:cell wall surface anchor family protein [Deltaproteobacteria bacterium]